MKNKISFHPSLHHSEFVKNNNNMYIANKKHTKKNFLYYIELFNLNDKIKQIKNKNLDDIADTLFQALAFIKYKL